MKPWVQYSLVRLAVFAAAFILLLLLGVQLWLAAIIAAVVGLCVSYIFFRGLRDAVAGDLAARRSGAVVARDVDADAEDRDQRA